MLDFNKLECARWMLLCPSGVSFCLKLDIKCRFFIFVQNASVQKKLVKNCIICTMRLMVLVLRLRLRKGGGGARFARENKIEVCIEFCEKAKKQLFLSEKSMFFPWKYVYFFVNKKRTQGKFAGRFRRGFCAVFGRFSYIIIGNRKKSS